MPIRTDAATVRAITGTSKTDPEIDVFITPASCMIDQVVDNGCASSISDACLAQAEAFLTAHLMASSGSKSSDAQIKRETFENYTVELQRSAAGQGVLSTDYGRTANSLVSGCLVTLNNPKPIIGFF